jgi:FtsH-binding integral membrane protein
VRVSFEVKFAILTLISALIGIMMKKRDYGEDIIKDVIKMFSVMFVLGFISVQMGIDLRVFGFILTLLLLGLIALLIFSGIERKHLSRYGVLLFALFIVYDTNNILQRNYNGDFLNASTDYFMDIVNLLRFYDNSD